ncbi:MAG: uracil-DNA glycosylase [Candidatus Omnitrophica bacterium]|nr:uracil-DNA glycosylase [Candidatus Omnitrophota bacterium]
MDICKWYELCPLKRFYEQGRLDKKWIDDYCWVNYSKCVRKRLEEQGIYHSDNMMPDGRINPSL